MASGILKDLADGAKRLGEIKKEFSDLEFNERILELRQLLLSAQTEILSLREEKLEIKSKFEDLQKSGALSANLKEIQGFKYDMKDGKAVGLPFCPACEVRDGKLYRLRRANDQYSLCPNCDKTFNAGQNGRVNGDEPDYSANY